MLRNAVTLLVGAVVLFSIAAFLFFSLKAEPLEFLVKVEKGETLEREYMARYNAIYEIRLETERKLDIQEQICLLGIETVAPQRCEPFPAELFISWTVEVDGKKVAHGHSLDSNKGYKREKMGKLLGRFPARQGVRYNITLAVERSSLKLQQTNPKIKIEISPKALKRTYIWAGLLVEVGCAFLLLAVILLFLRWTKKPDKRQGEL
ncbi:MAG: hypothetical protein OEV42_03525 [Deltaproteobacteria bacterium]|nr:hypothetical protein [Deltaproteobacteria bacterium]